MERTLAQMTLEELWQLFPIQLRGYDERYPGWYAQQAARLRGLFAGSVFRLNHIGSTAVPGLLSKPIVDLLLEAAADLSGDAVVGALAGDGWLLMARSAEPFRVDLNRGYTPQGFAEKVFHLHVVRPGDHDELYFRDYLLRHPEVADEYARLKRGLLGRFEHDRDGYTAAKTQFVTRTVERARQEFPGRYSIGASSA
jgi:GrpB-like predicted nucleotidyltransferase (UPF0157 family)